MHLIQLIRQIQFIRLVVVVMSLAMLTTGCSSIGKKLKSLVSGKGPTEQKTVSTPRFSERETVRFNSDRQYKRMNRQKFEEEAEIKADAGSLWVMEGQGSYLFAQNQTRVIGDLLNVRIEGGPKTQLQTKVRVISKLLERLDTPPSRGLASKQAGAAGAQSEVAPTPQAGQPAPGQPPAQAGQPGSTPEGQTPDATQARNEGPFNVQVVPTRIVDQGKDGSYRVRGMQPFMIGKREYKVIVTGIVRPEDFDDAGIDASKLLDPQFDIVSSKKGASL